MDDRSKSVEADFAAEVKGKAAQLGADIARIGSVERWLGGGGFDPSKVHVYPHTGYLPTDLLPSARSCIMVAVRVLDGVLDSTTTACKTTTVQGNFGYVHLNRELHRITYGLAKWLEEAHGHRSVPLGYNIGSRYDHRADTDPTMVGPAYGMFSMKRAAVLCGLGRKARNGLVASPELGTKMRLGCVITAAPIESDRLLEGSACPPACEICVRACPTKALGRAGRVDHLRCFSDVGRRGMHYEELRENFKKRYPIDEPAADYMENDLLAIDGGDNRLCKIACVALCPLGEHRMPDVVRRVKDFASIVPPVELQGFPPGR